MDISDNIIPKSPVKKSVKKKKTKSKIYVVEASSSDDDDNDTQFKIDEIMDKLRKQKREDH